jgi:hypothetical protein
VVLNFGAVLSSGTPDEIRAHPDVIAAYLGRGVAQPGLATAGGEEGPAGPGPAAAGGGKPAGAPMGRV